MNSTGVDVCRYCASPRLQRLPGGLDRCFECGLAGPATRQPHGAILFPPGVQPPANTASYQGGKRIR